MSDPISAGEIGGIFAGIVAVLATIGGGIRWLLGWKQQRAETLHAKLIKWEEKLDQREAKLDAEQAGNMAALERRVEKVEQQNVALRKGYYIVAGKLRSFDPSDPDLKQADDILRAAFPYDPFIPPDMAAQIRKLDQ
jgi:uncharacterized protein HemX